MPRCGPPYRFAAQHECGQASLPWANRGCSTLPRLLNLRELSAVPIARYFTVVGSALVVLLQIAGWSLPEPPPSFPDRPEIIDRATIRIRSERNWPEKVVMDTSQPAFPPPSIEVVPAKLLSEPPPDEMTDQTSVDALAKLSPDTRPIGAHRRGARAKPKPKASPSSQSTHVARTRDRNEQPTLGTAEECCRFEWAYRPAISKAASRKHAARRDSWIGWHSSATD
jgi:hypothetical protein